MPPYWKTLAAMAITARLSTPVTFVNNGVVKFCSILVRRGIMCAATQGEGEWVDGFLFVANRPILDFLNTKPILAEVPTELLPDTHALERWFIASGIVTSSKAKALFRGWRDSSEAAAFLKDLMAFRERLREAVLRLEGGSAPSDDFVKEVNARLLQHPLPISLQKRSGHLIQEPVFNPRTAADLWTAIIHRTADLLSEPASSRIRKCPSCVVHFFDTSRKGSRRWCSMNLCGNRLKVAAYQRRKRN
jgi:predicted RNA-binding Zn ribbon-like protein